MVSRFQSLCVRPPTPPPSKDFDHSTTTLGDADELLDFLSDPFATKTKTITNPITVPKAPRAATLVASKSLLSTPQTSPSSDAAIPSSSASTKKRVNFDAVPCAIPSSSFPQYISTPLHSSPLRPLPQTRVSKPLKSILKPMDAGATPPPADDNTPAHKYKSFAEMLESIVKQLASPTRSSRFDAYHSLHRTMQAYDQIPDMHALLGQMTLLTQFIRRDIQAVSVSGSGLDSQLIGQALKLLMALVRIPQLRSAMDDDFCIFIIERIVQVASDKEMPKTIVNTHLATLMQQNFRPKVVNVPRVERILDVLDTIHERVSGQSVLAYRIRIYRKLIQQKPDVMVKHTERWFKHTVQSLLSPQKDIHQSALDTAITAAKAMGTDRQLTRSVLTVLNQQKKDGDSIAKIVTKELEKMLDSENAAAVPQIWSAVTALLTGSLNTKQFPATADWLKVFNKCLDFPDEAVKMHANIAFGFLVHAVNIKENTEAVWSKICLTLPRHQLQLPRRGQWKTAGREAASSAYFLLLYYSLNPLASHGQLIRYWKEFVADFWSDSPESKMQPTHAMAACRVVSALLNGSRKPWDAQRALDLRPQAIMKREELPLLDPRWVRKSLAAILGFVEILLDATPWAMDDAKDEPAKTMWLSLLHSLNVASSQEIITSSESKDAMAHIVNLLRRMWKTHAAQLALSQQKEANWANKFCYLLETTVEKLGPVKFADKCLAQNQGDEIEVASTPSRSRTLVERTSPLLYFVDLLVNQSEGRLADAVRQRALKLLVEPCYYAQNTRLAGLEMLRDCSMTLSASSESTFAVAVSFLSQIATLTKESLRERMGPNERGSRQLGKEYELVVDILVQGASQSLKQSQGQELLANFAETVKSEAGESAVVLAVIEKVSERVLVRIPEPSRGSGLAFLNILLRNLPKMISRRTIEQARQELSPSSQNPARNSDFDPYSYFYTATVSVGCGAYRELSAYDVDDVRDFIIGLANSIKKCPITILAVYLRKIQDAICPWIEDADNRLQVKEGPLKDVHIEAVNMWKEVCAAVERLPNKTAQTLIHLEPLITAGFSSRRRGIVKKSIVTWNATFGKHNTLQYPTRLELAMRRLHNTELLLPGLAIGERDAAGPISFYESDDSSESPKRNFKSPRVRESPFRVAKSSRKTRSPAVSSADNRRTSTRPTPKVRLRHDNSQLKFEPIVSSPTNPFVQDSQILTERQREIFERQGDEKTFVNMGTASSPVRPRIRVSVPSPLEAHSDALSADDLPVENARTPLKRIPPVGPMDVFVGSSPTPRARSRPLEVASDQTSAATPTAVRTIQMANENIELGSSPPRFEKDVEANTTAVKTVDSSAGLVSDSFEYRQPTESFAMSFDEGTTLDDTALLGAFDTDMLDDEATAPETPAMPSSTIDLQLTAQIDAEMQAHKEADCSNEPPEGATKNQEAGTAPNSHQPSHIDATNDTEVEETQIGTPTPDEADSQTPQSKRSSESRVGDSFSSQAANAESPQISSLRRSGRHTSVSSPVPPKKRGRPRKAMEADNELADNIIVVPPKDSELRKKTRNSLPHNPQSVVTVPETTRKRGVLRSASMLSQVETHADDAVVVESTPPLKRAKRTISQDVSGAKSTPSSKDPQAKRLSHVRVTPKSAPSVRSSSVAAEEMPVAVSARDGPPTGEQKNNVAPQLPDATIASQQQTQSQSQQASGEVATPSRSFADRVILTPRSIINQLKNLKNALFGNPQLVLGRQEEREIDDALFDIRRGIHAAGWRSGGGGQ